MVDWIKDCQNLGEKITDHVSRNENNPPTVHNTIQNNTELRLENEILIINDSPTDAKITPALAEIFKLLNTRNPDGSFKTIKINKLIQVSGGKDAYRQRISRLRRSCGKWLNIISAKAGDGMNGCKIELL